jgi:hypothetical protein
MVYGMRATQHVQRAELEKSWVRSGHHRREVDFKPAPFLPSHEKDDDDHAPRGLQTRFSS